MDGRTNLVGRNSVEITELIAPHVDRDFRGRQVAQWIVDRNASSFGVMTNLPLALRRDLDTHFTLEEPEVLQVVESSDGSCKYLLGFSDGVGIESVSMRGGPRRPSACLHRPGVPSVVPSVSPALLAPAETCGRKKLSANTG